MPGDVVDFRRKREDSGQRLVVVNVDECYVGWSVNQRIDAVSLSFVKPPEPTELADWFPEMLADLVFAMVKLDAVPLGNGVESAPVADRLRLGDGFGTIALASFCIARLRSRFSRAAELGLSSEPLVEALSRLAPHHSLPGHIRSLIQADPAQAARRMAQFLEGFEQQFGDILGAPVSRRSAPHPEAARPDGREKPPLPLVRLIERAGGALELTQAARLLGVSRQALHARVKRGSALGMMLEAQYLLPRLQFIQSGTGWRVVDGLGELHAVFQQAGAQGWPMLEFLVRDDPNLAAKPIAALQEGHVQAVLNAARAMLELPQDTQET